MLPVLLTKIKTRDGEILEGIVIEPHARKKTKTAIVWLHGLSSRFYSGQTLIREMSRLSHARGMGYLKFNTRGHDVVARGKGGDKAEFLGSAFEKFEDSVLDIRAMISFVRRLGYTRVILCGHSTGANKALYYVDKTRDTRIKALALLGPVSDAGSVKFSGMRNVKKGIATARDLVKNQPEALMPRQYGIITAQRFLSLYAPGSPEDVFPYYNPKAEWKEFKSIQIPTAVIFGTRDEYTGGKTKQILDVFQKNATSVKSFFCAAIPGANHGFHKKEKKLTSTLFAWIKQNGL